MHFRIFLLTAAFVAGSARGATAQATTGPAVLYAEPGVRKLAVVATGTLVSPRDRSGEYVQVRVRGFVARALLGGRRDSFAVSVRSADVRLRAGPGTSETVVASLEQGMGLHLLKRAGSWAEVERTGWIRRSALPAALASNSISQPRRAVRRDSPRTTARRPGGDPPATVAAAPARAMRSVPADTDSVRTSTQVGAVTPAKSAGLSAAPDLAPIATIEHGASLIPLARERGWVRVRLEGWMREGDLTAADSAMLSITAADLQANPTAYVGRTVRWTVTALAFQTADPLRKEMRANEPYILARGPGSETALLYLALPPDLVDRAKALSAMAPIVVTARVRTGSSQPSGVPILDVLSLTKK